MVRNVDLSRAEVRARDLDDEGIVGITSPEDLGAAHDGNAREGRLEPDVRRAAVRDAVALLDAIADPGRGAAHGRGGLLLVARARERAAGAGLGDVADAGGRPAHRACIVVERLAGRADAFARAAGELVAACRRAGCE